MRFTYSDGTVGRWAPDKVTAMTYDHGVYHDHDNPCPQCNTPHPDRYVGNDECMTCAHTRCMATLRPNQHATSRESARRNNLPGWYQQYRMCKKEPHLLYRHVSTGKCLSCIETKMTQQLTARKKAARAYKTHYTPNIKCWKCLTRAQRRVSDDACTKCDPSALPPPHPRIAARDRGDLTYIPLEYCVRCAELAPRNVKNNRCTCEYQPMPNPLDIAFYGPRETARALGFKFYVNGLWCYKGHRGARYTSSAACVDCMRGVGVIDPDSVNENTPFQLNQYLARNHILDPHVTIVGGDTPDKQHVPGFKP